MMEFAELYVEKEEQPFKNQQCAGPEEHWPRQEVDLPKVKMAWPENSDQKARYANDQEIAEDIRRIDTVVGTG